MPRSDKRKIKPVAFAPAAPAVKELRAYGVRKVYLGSEWEALRGICAAEEDLAA